MRAFTVRVPATTSNLGPGFDCLGLALELYNEVTVERQGDGPPVVDVEGMGVTLLPRDAENLIVKAARSLGDLPGGLRLRCRNGIPLARGLGSSAAAVVSGLLVGDAVLDLQLPPQQLLEYAATMEGHPDNAGPALMGGLVLSLSSRKGWRFHRLAAHEDLRAVVCVPDFELPTSKARAVVPRTQLLENAIANVGRAALLATALAEGRWPDLGEAMEDRLHQPYRAPLVPGLEGVIAAARAAAPCGAALSGAGPSVVALCSKGEDFEAVSRAMASAFSRHGVKSSSLCLSVDRRGAHLKRK